MKSRTKPKRFSTVPVIKSTMRALAEDFSQYLTIEERKAFNQSLEKNDIPSLRKLASSFVDMGESDSVRFKARYQLASYLKRYTFPKDMYTAREAELLSIVKFLDNQHRVNLLSFQGISHETASVLQWAKGWISSCLGDYSELEHLKNCRWAKKSSVGVPMAKACIAERYELPITGSLQHLEWFRHTYLKWCNRPEKYMSGLQTEEKNLLFAEVETLGAVLVPKSYKERRMIVPNTTIGGLYTSGLGKVIENRLLRMGHDLRVMQDVHRGLARSGSLTGCLATADQSLASDNITCELAKMLLPLRWYNQIMKGRIGKIKVADTIVETKTLSTMGIGFTFPLQTLLFLGLLKGIACVSREKHAVVSVFGDDLVYNTRLHPMVVRVFTELGLTINTDKTFSEGSFRESCGGDFFHGMDVRPALAPEWDGCKDLSIRKYEAFVYKLINGLRRRWFDDKISGTLQMLGRHLNDIGINTCIVPNDFPDTSGVKTSAHSIVPPWIEKVRVPVVDIHGSATFRYLRFIAELRKEVRHEPYYWNALLENIEGFDPDNPLEDPHQRIPIHFGRELFVDIKAEVQPKAYRSKLTGKRLRKMDTYIATSVGRYRVQTGSSCCWTHAIPHQVDEEFTTEWMC